MPSFEVTLTSKGQITIPAELRARLNLKEGDKVEFFLDRSGRVLMRPRNLSPTAVFENAPIGGRKAPDMTDDEAIMASVLEKDRRSRRRHRAA
jgi:AbrB family looped-hinge helix DNA binding protein